MDKPKCEVCGGDEAVVSVKGTDGEGAFTWDLCVFCRDEVGGDD